MSASDAGAPARRSYVDWARGIAVLIMLLAHTLDAWTRAGDRRNEVYYGLTMLGGFAAPLFLFLAGLALVLSAERQFIRTGDRRAAMLAIVRRGVEIFILAFLFRIQAFVVSPGSWPITIFRVDILNVMGPAIAVAGLIWGWAGTPLRAALWSIAAGTAVAMVTPLTRTALWVGALPIWFQWHLRPWGDYTTFTLFPWAGFVFAGTACGAILASGGGLRVERRRIAGLAVAGAFLVGLGFYLATFPSIYPQSSFWTSSPTFFGIRVGVMLLALVALYAVVPLAGYVPGPFAVLERFGRNSLFVYWIHVELAYGYATWPLHHRLPLWAFPLAFLVFAAAMYRAIDLRDAVVSSWRKSRTAKPRAGMVPV